jgi:excinuclease ABC subunit C
MPFDIRELMRFPTGPGVYLMKDEEGNVLYVGKAKNLRSRVRQYFVPGGDARPQVPYLISRVAAVDTLVVPSEREALLLENNLIKQHQPPYNVLLKDDKTYVSIVITKHKWPMIRVVRYKGRAKSDGQYFGPYTSTYAARETFELLTRHFPLRRCSDRELENRLRPCILYQIKKCVAPCVNYCSHEEYAEIVRRVVDVLKGNDHAVIRELEEEREAASASLDFERAGEIHETILHLQHTMQQQKVDQAGSGDRDILGLYREGGEVVLSQMLFRDGKLVGGQHYSFSSVIQEDAEVFASFILQHYVGEEAVPHEIVLPLPVEGAQTLAQIISEGKRRRAQIIAPRRGDKKILLEMAKANAQATFARGRDEQEIRERRLLALQEKLELVNYPRRIECFDNSALSGTEPVAAMVAFTDGEMDKRRYRKYKLRPATGFDDYAAMRQVLHRRLQRGEREEDLPDLLIVDGGKGHLNVAIQVLEELNIVTIDLLGIAKERGIHSKGMTEEQLFRPGWRTPLLLPPHSEILFLLQRIRDEAHRFALSFQAKRRAKRLIQTALDKIPGIGAVKRRRLLTHFGSVTRIKAATEEELAAVKGITKRDIERLSELL